MQKRDLIQANASLENLRQNLDMKDFAKEILLEENYNKFIRSYKFTFWFQLIGVLAGFIVPSVVLLIIFKEFIWCNYRNFLDVCMDDAKYGNSPDKDISKICKVV